MWDATAAYVQQKLRSPAQCLNNVTDELYYFGGYQNTPNRVLPGAPRPAR